MVRPAGEEQLLLASSPPSLPSHLTLLDDVAAEDIVSPALLDGWKRSVRGGNDQSDTPREANMTIRHS